MCHTVRGRALGYRCSLEFLAQERKLLFDSLASVESAQAVSAVDGAPLPPPLPTPFSVAAFRRYLLEFQNESRRYAKRQANFLKTEPIYHWLTMQTPTLPSAAENIEHPSKFALSKEAVDAAAESIEQTFRLTVGVLQSCTDEGASHMCVCACVCVCVCACAIMCAHSKRNIGVGERWMHCTPSHSPQSLRTRRGATCHGCSSTTMMRWRPNS
jgi:hypothetical protein